MSKKCIILAGGLGTRLGSVLDGLPKCLAPIGSQSFIELLLDRLSAIGVDEFALSLGHRSEMVLDRLPQLQKKFSVAAFVEPVPLGTGGAILSTAMQLRVDEVLVANGDSIFDGDVSGLFTKLDQNAGELLRLAVTNVDDRSRFGGVELDSGVVNRFLEKGVTGPGLINAGMYRISLRAFDAYRAGDRFSLEEDIFPALVAQGQMHAYVTGNGFIDIGVPEDYLKFLELHCRA